MDQSVAIIIIVIPQPHAQANTQRNRKHDNHSHKSNQPFLPVGTPIVHVVGSLSLFTTFVGAFRVLHRVVVVCFEVGHFCKGWEVTVSDVVVLRLEWFLWCVGVESMPFFDFIDGRLMKLQSGMGTGATEKAHCICVVLYVAPTAIKAHKGYSEQYTWSRCSHYTC